MRILILILLLPVLLFAQKSSKRVWNESLDLIYGQKFLSKKTFNGELSDIYNPAFGQSIAYVGLGITDYFLISRGNFDHPGNVHFVQVLPQAIKVNDSISAHITGFNFGFTVHGFDLFSKQNNIDLLFNIGANTGRLRFYGNSVVTQKNPYFAPKLMITPRFTMGKICLQFNISYEVDVSSKNWRRLNVSRSSKINIERTSGTGLTVLASLGYVLPVRNPKPPPEEPELEPE